MCSDSSLLKTEELKLEQKSSSAKEGETILLHKRPYDFRRRLRERNGAPSCASIISNETAYFKNQFERKERLNFDLSQDLHFKLYNRSSEELKGLRLDSTKSCAVELNHSLLYENSADMEKTKDNSKL